VARKKNARDLEIPECEAPDSWVDIDASIWQGQKGRWAAPQHYMCSYMAMFPPELPHYFIERFTQPGDTVLDPFCGRGTAPVEAAAQNRIGIGNDLNPLAVALTRGKLSNPTIDDVLARINELETEYDSSEWRHFSGAPRKIRMIFHIKTLRQLMFLKRELDWSIPGTDAFLTAVLMGALHGSSKGFLSLPMPNTFSMGWGYIASKIEEDPVKWSCPDRDTFEVIRERVKRQLAKGYLTGSGKAIYGDVRDLDQKIDHGSVQLLFTSPPYLKVIKYGLYNWIRLWFLTDSGSHEEVDEVLDDTHALVEYLDFMRDTLTATLPLMDKDRGISCWAIGDVKGLNLAWAVWHHAARGIEIEIDDGSILRYKLIAIVEDNIPAEQKVTKLWKTMIHKVIRLDSEGEIVEVIGESSEESEAKRIASEADVIEGQEIEIISEVTNDKSGKATSLDRILIIAPENAEPRPYLENDEMVWEPIYGSSKQITLKSFSNH
jgi:site-specific DNA-methyltransferase (adenine-specific)